MGSSRLNHQLPCAPFIGPCSIHEDKFIAGTVTRRRYTTTMGSEEVHKRKGQTLRLVQTILCIITITVFLTQGIKIFKGKGTKKNTIIGISRVSTSLRSSSREEDTSTEPKALPIVWSHLRTLEVITDLDKPVVGRKYKNLGRREFRFSVSLNDWTGTATTPSHHDTPFTVRIPAHAAAAFQKVMSNATMFRATYAHAADPAIDAQDKEREVYRPFFTHHEVTKYRIRFGFEDYRDDFDILSISRDHCDLKMLPVQCGHFPWVVLPFGTRLSPEPSLQWIINSNVIDEALEAISLYMRG